MEGPSAVLVPENGAQLVPAKRKANSGSFKPGNQARRTNGLQAKSEKGTAYLSKRVAHMTNRKLREAIEANRPIDSLQIPSVKRWCRHSILNERAWAEIIGAVKEGKKLEQVSSKTLEIYRTSTNALMAEEAALGWSLSARSQVMRDLASAVRDRQAAQAQMEIQQKYGPKRVAS